MLVNEAAGSRDGGHLACPFCASYDVVRLFLASMSIDSCECLACSARWDEDSRSGEVNPRLRRGLIDRR